MAPRWGGSGLCPRHRLRCLYLNVPTYIRVSGRGPYSYIYIK
jgi:hypothetical protein